MFFLIGNCVHYTAKVENWMGKEVLNTRTLTLFLFIFQHTYVKITNEPIILQI